MQNIVAHMATIDGVWIGNWVYCTLTTHYNWVSLDSLNNDWVSLDSLSHNWPLTLLSLMPGPRTSCRPTSQSPNCRLKLLCPWTPSQGPEPPFSDWLSELFTEDWTTTGWCPGYIAWEQTTEKTLPRNRPQRSTHCCMSSRYQGTRSSFVDPSGLQSAHHNIVLYKFYEPLSLEDGAHTWHQNTLWTVISNLSIDEQHSHTLQNEHLQNHNNEV
jgi:hypothetical protein